MKNYYFSSFLSGISSVNMIFGIYAMEAGAPTANLALPCVFFSIFFGVVGYVLLDSNRGSMPDMFGSFMMGLAAMLFCIFIGIVVGVLATMPVFLYFVFSGISFLISIVCFTIYLLQK